MFHRDRVDEHAPIPTGSSPVRPARRQRGATAWRAFRQSRGQDALGTAADTKPPADSDAPPEILLTQTEDSRPCAIGTEPRFVRTDKPRSARDDPDVVSPVGKSFLTGVVAGNRSRPSRRLAAVTGCAEDVDLKRARTAPSVVVVGLAWPVSMRLIQLGQCRPAARAASV